jgi:hypothetical protein
MVTNILENTPLPYKNWCKFNAYRRIDIAIQLMCIVGVSSGLLFASGGIFSFSITVLITRFAWNEGRITTTLQRLISSGEDVLIGDWKAFSNHILDKEAMLHYSVFSQQPVKQIIGVALIKGGYKDEGAEVLADSNLSIGASENDTIYKTTVIEAIEKLKNEPKMNNAQLYLEWIKDPKTRYVILIVWGTLIILPWLIRIFL